MQFLTLLLVAAPAIVSVSANMGPPKKKQTLSPTVLSDCPCTAIVTNFLSCQTGSDESCVCSKSWYGSMLACRDCLQTAKGVDLSDDTNFFTNFGATITKVFTACTETGGSVNFKDDAICGYANRGEACVHLSDKKGGQSWASNKGNRGTYVLDLGNSSTEEEDNKPTKTASSESESESATAMATETDDETPSSTKTASATYSGPRNSTATHGIANDAPIAPDTVPFENDASLMMKAGSWIGMSVIAVMGLVL